MAKKNQIDIMFAVSDTIIGAVAILVFVLGRCFSPQVTALAYLSTPFLTSIALPAFVLFIGIASLARATFAPLAALFASFLVVVNSLAVLLSPTPPLFLDSGASADMIMTFQIIFPVTAIVYFCPRALIAFFEMRNAREQHDATQKSALLHTDEYFCAACGERLRRDDDVCPSCKAIIRGQHCPVCGYEGKDSDFKNDRCPRCGHQHGT
jgi:hypothetical protein